MRALLVLVTSIFVGTAALQEPIRTADINLRHLTSADFPRVNKARGKCLSYENIDPTKRTVTVNNLIVVTNGGVLIAESQGTVDNVKRLVAEVAAPHAPTDQVRRRGVGARRSHGRNCRLPAGVTYLAHPFSAPRIKQPTEPVADKRVS